MILTINNVDITPYIATGGVNYSRSDLEGKNGGTSINGLVFRDRIAIKNQLTITCRPLTTEEASILYTLIEPEYVNVSYTSPREGTTVNQIMFSNNVPATYAIKKDNIDYWSGITFTLKEK